MSTEHSHHCQHVVGGWGFAQVFDSFYYPGFLYIMCARTYIPIHNALAEAVCCCFPRNTVFTKFSL